MATATNRYNPVDMQAASSFVIEPIALRCDDLPRPLDFSGLFGNASPVELEIGFGKGTFLTEQARSRPDTNFLGIEYANWFFRYASDRLRRHGCMNARTVRAEATWFIREFVADASIRVMHVYFPDPWPKARHHKRRLLQPKWMPEVLRVLEDGGRLQVVTDHRGYFEESIEPAIRGSGLVVVDYSRPGSAGDGEFVGTNFERKYAREGRPFHALAAVRPPRVR